METFQAVFLEEKSKLFVESGKNAYDRRSSVNPSWYDKVAVKSFEVSEIITEESDSHYCFNAKAIELWDPLPTEGESEEIEVQEESESFSESDDYDSNDEMMMHFTSRTKSGPLVKENELENESGEFSTIIIQCKK